MEPGRDLLVVDDDADLAEALADALRDEGHAVRVAGDGQEGLALVAERVPDAIVLDGEMPVLDGAGMVRRLVADDVGHELIPIVLFSGVADLRRLAARVGTPYFLPKPSSLDHVIAVVRRAIDERRPPRPEAAA
ncbi:MAG: response regulator [Myxococcota bacterium]